MAMFQSKRFILGKDKSPEWFSNECSKGRAKMVYDDDGELNKVVVYSSPNNYEALPGDTIILLKSGLAVIVNDKKSNKKEVHEDEE